METDLRGGRRPGVCNGTNKRDAVSHSRCCTSENVRIWKNKYATHLCIVFCVYLVGRGLRLLVKSGISEIFVYDNLNDEYWNLPRYQARLLYPVYSSSFTVNEQLLSAIK